DGDHFVDDQDLRFEMRRDGKAKSNMHAAAIALHRSIKELLDIRKCNDLIELARDLGTSHPKNGAVEKDVFPAGQFGMEPCAHLEEARDPAPQDRASPRRLRNPT